MVSIHLCGFFNKMLIKKFHTCTLFDNWNHQWIHDHRQIQRGTRNAPQPLGPISLIFMRFSGNKLPKNMTSEETLGVRASVQEILDPSLGRVEGGGGVDKPVASSVKIGKELPEATMRISYFSLLLSF